MPYRVECYIVREYELSARLVIAVAIGCVLICAPTPERVAGRFHRTLVEYSHECACLVRAVRIHRSVARLIEVLIIGHRVNRCPCCVKCYVRSDRKGLTGCIICIHGSGLRLILIRVPTLEYVTIRLHRTRIKYGYGRACYVRAVRVGLRSGRCRQVLIVRYRIGRKLLPSCVQINILSDLKTQAGIVCHICHAVRCGRLIRVPTLEYIAVSLHGSLIQNRHGAAAQVRAVRIRRCRRSYLKCLMIGYSVLRDLFPYCVQSGVLCNVKCIISLVLYRSGGCSRLIGIPAQERITIRRHGSLIQNRYRAAGRIRTICIRLCAGCRREVLIIGYREGRDLLPYCVKDYIAQDHELFARIIIAVRGGSILILAPTLEGVAVCLHLTLIEYGYGRAIFVRAVRVGRSRARLIEVLIVGHRVQRHPYCVKCYVRSDRKGLTRSITCIHSSGQCQFLLEVPALEYIAVRLHRTLIEHGYGRTG